MHQNNGDVARRRASAKTMVATNTAHKELPLFMRLLCCNGRCWLRLVWNIILRWLTVNGFHVVTSAEEVMFLSRRVRLFDCLPAWLFKAYGRIFTKSLRLGTKYNQLDFRGGSNFFPVCSTLRNKALSCSMCISNDKMAPVAYTKYCECCQRATAEVSSLLRRIPSQWVLTRCAKVIPIDQLDRTLPQIAILVGHVVLSSRIYKFVGNYH